MDFRDVNEALRTLEDLSVSPRIHQEAIRYLAGLDECFEAENLVKALQSDDAGVRWEAGNLLARLEDNAVPAILRALMDPKQVSHLWLREGVIHVIHRFGDPNLKKQLAPLIDAIKGPSADIVTMREAYKLLKEIDPSTCPDEDMLKE